MSGFGDIAPAGRPPSGMGRCQARCRAKPEQAERDFSPASQEHTGMPVLRPLAGSRSLLPHSPAAPDSPVPVPRVGGIPSGSLWWGAGGLHVSELCLLYWAGLAFICLMSLETLAAGRAGRSTHTLPRAEPGFNISHL